MSTCCTRFRLPCGTRSSWPRKKLPGGLGSGAAFAVGLDGGICAGDIGILHGIGGPIEERAAALGVCLYRSQGGHCKLDCVVWGDTWWPMASSFGLPNTTVRGWGYRM